MYRHVAAIYLHLHASEVQTRLIRIIEKTLHANNAVRDHTHTDQITKQILKI